MNEQVVELLEDLASKLGTTSEFLWTTLVRGTFAEGIAMTVGGALLLVVAIPIGVKLIKKGSGFKTNYGAIDDIGVALIVVGCVLVGGGAIVGARCLYLGTIAVAAPDYAALRWIINAISQ